MRVFLILLLFFSYVYAEHKLDRHTSNYGDDHNKEHIQEHLKTLNKDNLELSEEDAIYYLFVIHDLNGDGFLDGHELRVAMSDFDHEELDLSLKEVTEMIDHVLEEDDINGDGLISWSEYLESQLYHDT
ncbi:Multiple coagulation factor deficiency protein 2 [Choanephora cucurbitarum]|uniref:Multiple coagulation factor deficiency protein 2 n=1 Tax=Choanephora cucurbitarum TaxID=101091 RepID=A0A1C7NFC8_9FUNG|nr:Multiple coagulation factor deficiency protein 2 [Choanephora cucurbitarum]